MEEQEQVERLQEKDLGWMLGVDRETPGYIVREECKRSKLKVKAGEESGKVRGQNGRKGRVQDTVRVL
jgi:hypothetical protein